MTSTILTLSNGKGIDLVYFPTLREANEARQREWDTGNQISLSWRGNELAGEVGEAIDAVLCGSPQEAADELADVVICVDLASMSVGGPERRYLIAAPTSYPLRDLCADLGLWTGRACNVLKKLERERLGIAGSRARPEDLAEPFMGILRTAGFLANGRRINLEAATARKFNATSEKVGLKTRMGVAA